MKLKTPHCDFYNEPCLRHKCIMFGSRPMTDKEFGSYCAADIPIIDRTVHDWCLKYNKQIEQYVDVSIKESL